MSGLILAMLLESMLALISTQPNVITMVVSKWLARSMMFGLILLVVALSKFLDKMYRKIIWGRDKQVIVWGLDKDSRT
jgi:hypothetical protein